MKYAPMGAPIMDAAMKGAAVRRSTIFLRRKVMAAELVVMPFSSMAVGIATSMSMPSQ